MGDVIEVSATIAAPADTVYAAVSDITRMGEWSPECRGGRWLGGATEARPGARFRGTNRNGPWRWATTCTVLTADPGRELSWEVRSLGRPVALWCYRFAGDGHGGTAVVESTEDRRGAVIKALAPLATGVGDRAGRNKKTMEITLARVKQVVEAGVP
jgi:uncharacterized protein YndB with AHSA1/START domain